MVPVQKQDFLLVNNQEESVNQFTGVGVSSGELEMQKIGKKGKGGVRISSGYIKKDLLAYATLINAQIADSMILNISKTHGNLLQTNKNIHSPVDPAPIP